MRHGANAVDLSRRALLYGGVAVLASHGLAAAQPAQGTAPGAFSVAPPELAGLDAVLSNFMKEQGVPGASVAVSKDARLVYARGFGVADRERNEAVNAASLFRIGSVSKPITAVAILQLIERGKLAFDAKVWEVLALPEPADARWKQVTLLNLLQHTGGWDRRATFDPMFAAAHIAKTLNASLPIGAREIVRYMLEQPLDFDPGARHAYSNFGYCLLGRVIETVSGAPYERYVQQEVLAPLGIRRMRLGRSASAQRAPAEVAYYDGRQRYGPAAVGRVGARVPFPYGVFSMETLDASGGWIGSAPELVRFACAFDDPETCRILRPETIARMFARPAGEPGIEVGGTYYGCGWTMWSEGRRDRAHSSHMGMMPGTAAYLARRNDGINWAALFNTNGPAGTPLADTIRDAMLAGLARVSAWPASDAFAGLL